MASIIEGYSYDIFISYRQKDNKYDGWVTEFVDNLKRELESMFKEEVSVYFDINPSDYLLESYDVDASLKDKLKCLIFIPIISRTYCDPNSFAWDNELKAFVDQASDDKFGFKVKLPSGNVANRVLPIRIHDLDPADIKLFESVVDGIIRSIDFVYKETGVNRQLRAKDDEIIIKTHGQNLYRDQINKVALAIKEIIESMKSHAAPVKTKEKEIKVRKAEEKKEIDVEEASREEIVQSDQETRTEAIEKKKEKRYKLLRKSRLLIPGILGTLILISGLIFVLNRYSKIKWAKKEALTQSEQFINENNFTSAFNLLQKAEKYISEDPKFKVLASLAAARLTILSEPPGAEVNIREYSLVDKEWKKIGSTPIDSINVPNNTFYLVKFNKEGYEDVHAVIRTGLDTLYRKLFRKGTIPQGMVYIEGYMGELTGNYLKEKNGFFMDRYEVTNKQYKEFVDKGGYSNPVYWKNKFIKDGKFLTWEEAMAEFTDKSGRAGPSNWEGGDYPDDHDNFPVSGVSWYEAAAFAEFMNKSLPTNTHWVSGAGLNISNMTRYFSSAIVPLSNFNNKGPEPTGKFHGINTFGAYDMAGNVKEWCWNETEIGRITRGGAWDDVSYLYSGQSQLSSFDRSERNGFRCVKYINKGNIPESAFQKIILGAVRDYYKEKPVPESIFMIYKDMFRFDKKDLNSKIERKDESHQDCIIERITYDPAYGNERAIAYLFIPKNANPPFQTLIYLPGITALTERDLPTSSTLEHIDYLYKNGRAVMYPIYKGTFERNDGQTTNVPNHSRQYTEDLIKWVKDFSRSIDYLETRSDIDTSKLGYYGVSWGGRLGGIIPSIENRLKVSVLIVGGFNYRTTNFPYPEAEEHNYVPRIKLPVLMLNGKYDYNFPLETTVKPFFDLLGTPEKDKRLRIYETDHYVPKSEVIKEALNWLDKYFGPVKYQPNN